MNATQPLPTRHSLMKYLSVCSGIEAATVAWHPLGWEAVAFAEVEKFPCALLAHHYPYVPNLGDMTKINGEAFRGTVDLIVGGTPCQDFSVAGKRAGMAGERGGLALAFVKLVSDVRPRWVVWENVPGVLSSGSGADFLRFLRLLADCGYCLAWRVLDAQYFGVPQRRRRVFVVGHLGDWRPAAQVLFEPHSLRRGIAPRGEARADVAGTLEGSLGRSLAKACNAHGVRMDLDTETLIATALRSDGHDASEDGTGRQNLVVGFAQNTRGEVRLQGGDGSICGALGAEEGMKQRTYLMQKSAVRRLTPRECERLQGFPDDYTLIPYRKKTAADGPRYKALGNSMAVPVMRWIGERIELFGKG